jgi:hypothetical protein
MSERARETEDHETESDLPTADQLFLFRLLEILRSEEFRTSCIQRLVAACIEAPDAHRVVASCIEEVREDGHGPQGLPIRLLEALDRRCAESAEIRRYPYRKVVGPIIRGWWPLMGCARKNGLTEEEGYAVLRDVLRRLPSSRWLRVKNYDREVLEMLEYGLIVVGATRICGVFVRS